MRRVILGAVGAGYRGPNPIRNFCACPLTEVAAFCESIPARLGTSGRTDGHRTLLGSIDRLPELPIRAVAIAIPRTSPS